MLFSSFNELPDGYATLWEIDMMKNKKFAVLINIAAVVIAIAMLALFIWLYPVGEVVISAETLLYLLLVLIGVVFTTVVHELIHGLFFKLGTKEKLKFKFNLLYASASVPTAFFRKWHYFMVGLAPFVIIDLVLTGVCFLVGGGSWLFTVFAVLAVHTSGCVGDFYISFKLLTAPADILIRDTGTGMTFYGRKLESEG